MKKFIITVDTEGDNLWNWHDGDVITTNNAKFLNKFQKLCERYNFVPVYLVNYEMACNDEFVNNFKEKAKLGLCEIGMHLHAWNSPPIIDIENKYDGQTFITEYNYDIIKQKHIFLRDLIKKKFDIIPVTYRSGRWATNDDLFKVLDELGFIVDCSVTPGISHSLNKGRSVAGANDYTKSCNHPYVLRNNLVEVPMTTINFHTFSGQTIRDKLRNLIKGKKMWFRTALSDYDDLLTIIKKNESKDYSYLEFMIHSSELMPGGSPYFKTVDDINNHYKKIEKLFDYVSENYEGISMKNFYKYYISKKLF